MNPQQLRHLADQKILEALRDGPKTANEIAAVLRREVLESWAEEQGLEIEWGDEGRGPSEPVGARLCAIASARRRGVVFVPGYELLTRLPRMEKRGLVERIQLEGHRPMLWKAA